MAEGGVTVLLVVRITKIKLKSFVKFVCLLVFSSTDCQIIISCFTPIDLIA